MKHGEYTPKFFLLFAEGIPRQHGYQGLLIATLMADVSWVVI